MLVIPAIDLRQGKCVRLTQGRKEEATVYDGDPVRVAEGFEKDGARMLHVVDLDGAFSESKGRNRDVLRDLVRAVTIPVQFGGGLRRSEAVCLRLGDVKLTAKGTMFLKQFISEKPATKAQKISTIEFNKYLLLLNSCSAANEEDTEADKKTSEMRRAFSSKT